MSSCFVKIDKGLNVTLVINYQIYFRSMYFHLEFFWKNSLRLFLFVLRVSSIYEVTTYQQNNNLVYLVVISAWKHIYFREYICLLPTKLCRATVVWLLDILYCEDLNFTQTNLALFS